MVYSRLLKNGPRLFKSASDKERANSLDSDGRECNVNKNSVEGARRVPYFRP